MKVYDAHVHVMDSQVEAEALAAKLKANGVAGCALLSLPPEIFPPLKRRPVEAAERLENLVAWQSACKDVDVFPFFWIDPLEDDAAEQVALATSSGVSGFKIIMNRDFPSHPQAMDVFKRIAASGKPAIIHTGILWDGRPSSKYTRPAEYECLLDVPKIKFALCHMSWPWLDECLAVYGKFQHALKVDPGVSAEMFIDLTPGTPEIYREEALTKLFKIGYPVENNILFGTDCFANAYDVDWLNRWRALDLQTMDELAASQADKEKCFGLNFLRFANATLTKS